LPILGCPTIMSGETPGPIERWRQSVAAFALRYAALLVVACSFAAAAGPHARAQDPANSKPNANAPPHPAGSQPDATASSVERDPFRACVAAHADDPRRHLNCDWSGNYTKSR
jgi:hypothetical protein